MPLAMYQLERLRARQATWDLIHEAQTAADAKAIGTLVAAAHRSTVRLLDAGGALVAAWGPNGRRVTLCHRCATRYAQAGTGQCVTCGDRPDADEAHTGAVLHAEPRPIYAPPVRPPVRVRDWVLKREVEFEVVWDGR